MKKSLRNACLFLALGIWGVNTEASLLAYEDFDYSTGNFVGTSSFSGDSTQWDGQNGGSGWGSHWGWWAGSAAGNTIVTPGLSYTDANNNDLVVAGNAAMISRSARNAARILPSGSSSDTTYWISFLVQPSYTQGLDDDIHSFRFELRNDSTIVFSAGKLVNADQFYGLQRQSNNSGIVKDLSTIAPVNNQTEFLVVRYHIGSTANDGTLHLFINPLLGIEPTLASADAAVTGLNSATMAFNGIGLTTPAANPGGETGRNRAIFDEIRLGTSYNAVTPIPEPSTLMLLGISAVAGLFGWKRRRR